MYPGQLTDVPGFQVGHEQNREWGTGVTVILPPEGTTGGVEVRGGAPGSRETDLLRPENMVSQVHAVVLSGGSAFGLESASGVMNELAARGIGLDTGFAKVPIVCSAVLYDLGLGQAKWPDMTMGKEALLRASSKDSSRGNIGAGTGCSVGKIAGMDRAMKSGLGQASLRLGDLVVSCLIAVNAVGDIRDPEKSNRPIAGLLGRDGKPGSTLDFLMDGESGEDLLGKNTTIGCIATNAKLDKAGTLKVCQMGQDGLARSIEPVHTLFDGDSLFCLASNRVESEPNLVGILAAKAVQRAIVNAGESAEDAYGLLSYASL